MNNFFEPLVEIYFKNNMLKLTHFVLVLICVVCQLQYGDSYMVGNNPYRRRETLDHGGKFQLEFEVDQVQSVITFNVTVRTRGWVGFGLSDSGKMSGADIIIGGVTSHGKSYFSDFHAVGNQQPELDQSQDWKLLSSSENATHTMLSFCRAVDTCDSQDYPITKDKISLIWAFGEKDSEHGYYHYRNRGEFQAYLIHPDYAPQIITNKATDTPEVLGEGKKELEVWTVRHAMRLPVRDTSYWCTMQKAPVLRSKHHMVGFQVRLDTEESVRHVHHVLIHKCNPPRGRDARSMFDPFVHTPGQECLRVKSPTGPMPTEYCTEFFHSWAVGARPFFNPPSIGIPFGSDPDEYYVVQAHLDNPMVLADVQIEMKIDFFYTPNLRENEGGLMLLRHESPGLSPSLLIPPYSIDHRTYGICGSDCTRTMLPKKGINIFAVYLHTHNYGTRIRLQHFRKNRELPWIASDENYSFDYQQMRALNEEHRVMPGDQLVARCIYDTTSLNRTVVGGFSTSQEMCVAIIMYHSKLENYMQCSSEIHSDEYRAHFLAGVENITWSDRHLEFLVNPPHPLAGLRISEVSDNHVDWTLERREELDRFHLYHPHVNRCPQELYSLEDAGGAHLHSGTAENPQNTGVPVTFPMVVRPYQPEPSCSLD